jgi:hypothetical protein
MERGNVSGTSVSSGCAGAASLAEKPADRIEALGDCDPHGFGRTGLRDRFKLPFQQQNLVIRGDERDRTVGLLNAIEALSQLSYIPVCRPVN